MRWQTVILFAGLSTIALTHPAAAQQPVQVFILAGQSNMEGKGTVEGDTTLGTLRYMVNNEPATYGHLVDTNQDWVVRSDTFIYSTTDPGVIGGGLTVGYGSAASIGPELGFGTTMGNTFTQDVLLIKTAWGGKSLAVDFLPPSAESYPKPVAPGDKGYYYQLMLSEVQTVLDSIASHVPGYSGQGYELKGFGWHQGYNDRINNEYAAAYEQNMATFINDVRFDLGASDLPFVIGTTSMGDSIPAGSGAEMVIDAQLAMADPAQYPDFDGNVATINTRPFWRDAANAPANEGHHWNRSAESYYLIGDAMGDAMAAMSGYSPFLRHYLDVHQQTGEIRIISPSNNAADMDLQAYSITSAAGALNAAHWTPIAGHYDGVGDGSVDAGNWTVTTAALGELSEAAVPGGSDGLIAIGQEVSLGTGTWIQNPIKDIQATYTDTDGAVHNLYVHYSGFLNILADLNTDGAIDIDDWAMFAPHIMADMSSLTAPQAYQRGDLDGDFDNDLDDFDLFRRAFEAQNPEPGAFAAMLAEYQVPEPSSLLLLGGAIAAACGRRRRCSQRKATAPARHRTAASLTAAALLLAIITAPASAELLAYEAFNYSVGPLAGQAGGTGMAGAWADGPDGGTAWVYDQTGGIPVTWDGVVDSLPTDPAPPSARYVALADDLGDKFEAYRPLAQSAGAMAGADGVLWMSAAWHFPGQNYGAHVGLALATDSLRNRGYNIDTTGGFGSGAGDGIGVGRGTTDWTKLTPIVFDNGSAQAQTTGNALPSSLDNIVVLKFEFSATGPDTVRAFSFAENITPTETSFNTNAVAASYAIDETALDILTFDQNRTENAIDEIRIGDTFADVITGIILPPQISLRVNTTSGATQLLGDGDQAALLNYYQITSDAGSLDPTGWHSLADQDFDGNGPPSGTGDGWEEGGAINPHGLAEAYLLGDSSIDTAATIRLGAAYDTDIDAQDLVFRYRISTGQNFYGPIEYFSPMLGDVDGDGDVDNQDIGTVTGNFTGAGGSTLLTWADGDMDGDGDVDNQDIGIVTGAFTGAITMGEAPIPEPASSALLLFGMAAMVRRRH